MKNAIYYKSLGAFIVLLLVPLIYYLPYGTALVWTVVVPIIPVFILIVGYNRWRGLCPLSWFASLSQEIHIVEKKKLGPWFENNYYLLQFTLLTLAFCARFFLLNESGLFLALFFITVFGIAFFVNLFFSGKTWCNYFCPVGVVEKIYCGSNAKLSEQTSACSTCVACKKNCPDIDLENSYWKENLSKQKRIVFYAFPGLVFGFYAYFFALTGSWDYYFDGIWTESNKDLFAQGFYFLPQVPKLIAAPLTLVFFSYLSYLLFNVLENNMHHFKWSRNKDKATRGHIVKMIAAFSAFNIFYLFAGAPAYAHFPLTYAFFHFSVIVISTIVLFKEIHREERFFIQERFAQNILHRWQSTRPPSNNLKEVYYTYSTQEKDYHEKLEMYKATILELVEDGTLTKDDFTVMDRIKDQLGISLPDHKRIIREIQKENANLFDENSRNSVEKTYQLKLYKLYIEEQLEDEIDISDEQFTKIQKQFHITKEEHTHIYHGIIHSNQKLIKQLELHLHKIEWQSDVLQNLPLSSKRSSHYLRFIINTSLNLELTAFIKLMMLIKPDEKTTLSKVLDTKPFLSTNNIKDLQNIVPEYSENLGVLLQLHSLYDNHILDTRAISSIAYALKKDDDYLTSALLFFIYEHPSQESKSINLQTYIDSPNGVISQIATAIFTHDTYMSTIETIAYLQGVPLFSSLHIEDLYLLANSTTKVVFGDQERIVKEGEFGHSLFIITQGIATIEIRKKHEHKFISQVHDGDYIGEISIISKEARTATVTASGYVEALEISEEAFESLMLSNPQISLNVMQNMTKRLIKQKEVL